MIIDFSKYPYPRKIRHHVGTNLYFPINELTFKPNYYPPLMDDIAPNSFFRNHKAPDVLDIGCGKSKFLLEYAFQNPDKNILGFEIRKILVEWAQNLINSENLQNAWVEWYTAVNGFTFLQKNSIEKVFYLFPDPWPKKKQQNRRLFSLQFLENLHSIIKSDGKLYLATDCDYVNEHHVNILNKFNLFDFHYADKNEWNFPITNKENFCLKKDIEVYRLVCKPKK